MSQQLDDEGKLVSMLMEANKYVRYAAICDKEGKFFGIVLETVFKTY